MTREQEVNELNAQWAAGDIEPAVYAEERQRIESQAQDEEVAA